MEHVQTFYTNLFSIEITAFGIITATVFVFVQILHTNYSYADMRRSIMRGSVRLYGVLSLVIIVFTGIGSLFLSVSHDFLPRVDLASDALFRSEYTALLTLVAFVCSVGLGIYTVLGRMRLLNPAILIREHVNQLNIENVRKSLYNKYGVPEPFPPLGIVVITRKEPAEDDTDRQVEEATAKYERDRQEYERLTKEVAGAPDVFEGLSNLMCRAIGSADMCTIRSGLRDYQTRMQEIEKQADKTFPLPLFARHSADTLALFLDTCRRHKLESLSPEFVRANREGVVLLLEGPLPEAVLEALRGWKDQGDKSIAASDRPLFREIVESYKAVADAAFKRSDKARDDDDRVLDECFRHLGWLAERLLMQRGVEPKPVMYDSSYEDEFEVIYNALMSFDMRYWNERPTACPLIFFDAVHVLFARLLVVYRKRRSDEGGGSGDDASNVKGWLFACANVYASFARKALKVGNGSGVALAAMRLTEVHEQALEAGAEDVARDSIGLIVDTAIRVVAGREKMAGNRLADPVGFLEKTVLASSLRDSVQAAVRESYSKCHEASDAAFEYIRKLGNKLDTNFGFMFDPRTGESYPDDDVRRR